MRLDDSKLGYYPIGVKPTQKTQLLVRKIRKSVEEKSIIKARGIR